LAHFNPTWLATNSQTLAAGSSAAGGTFAVCNGAVKDPEADEGIAVCEQRLLCHLKMASSTARKPARNPWLAPRGLVES